MLRGLRVQPPERCPSGSWVEDGRVELSGLELVHQVGDQGCGDQQQDPGRDVCQLSWTHQSHPDVAPQDGQAKQEPARCICITHRGQYGASVAPVG